MEILEQDAHTDLNGINEIKVDFSKKKTQKNGITQAPYMIMDPDEKFNVNTDYSHLAPTPKELITYQRLLADYKTVEEFERLVFIPIDKSIDPRHGNESK